MILFFTLFYPLILAIAFALTWGVIAAMIEFALNKFQIFLTNYFHLL